MVSPANISLLQSKNILIEAKSFAIGVRIEHLQSFIDKSQYKFKDRPDYLPPASFSLVSKTIYKGSERGVFSFCMCPGGIIAPCATSPGEVVTNGWSPSKRDYPTSNSGIVRIYQFVNGDWYQKGQDLNGDANYDYFGFSISLSNDGNTVAVGAKGKDDNGSNSGDNVTNISETDIAAVQQHFLNRWNYDPGKYQGYNHETFNNKILFNINL